MGAATQALPAGFPRRDYSGTNQKFIRDITMSNSYATGGDTLDLESLLGVNRVLSVHLSNAGGYVAEYDIVNSKVKVYEAGADGAALDEVTATTDLSSTVFRATIEAR